MRKMSRRVGHFLIAIFYVRYLHLIYISTADVEADEALKLPGESGTVQTANSGQRGGGRHGNDDHFVSCISAFCG